LNKFGFTQHPFFGNNLDVYDQAIELGLQSIRISFPWASIETAPRACYNQEIRGQKSANRDCKWAPYDQWVTEATSKGLNVAVLVFTTPDWARDPNIKGCNNPRGIPPTGEQPPGEPAPFEAFLTAAVKHTKGKVRAWLLWSEVDTPANWCGTPDLYRERILKPGTRAIKRADPRALVVAPGLYMASKPLTAPMLDRWLTDDGIHLAAPIDAAAIDGYLLPEELRRSLALFDHYRRCMRSGPIHCIDTIWITEFGFGGLPSCPPDRIVANGDEEIAQRLWDTLRLCAESSRCGRAFIWTLSSDDYASPSKACFAKPLCDFALLDQCKGFRPRPRYTILRRDIHRFVCKRDASAPICAK
jgi:hypothetical protein